MAASAAEQQVDMFKAFLHAMAGESHDRAARVGIFGGAVQVVDGVLSGGQTGSVWGKQWPRNAAFSPLRARDFVASAVPQRRVFAASAAVFAASATQVKSHFCTEANLPPANESERGGVPILD